jgi:molecular chaperone DnaK
LTGIPPAPRGVPQVQVAFDIDANGILQVTAVDKTTGREQSVTIQGASTLSEAEVNQMIRQAEQFAQSDRERRERVEKRNRAETLANDAERQLKEVTLDFGSQFASVYRRRIEALVQELRQALSRDDERRMDRAESDLKDALFELKREVRLQYSDDDDDDFFGSIRRTFTGEGDRDRDRDRDNYGYRERDSYGYKERDSYGYKERDRYPERSDWASPNRTDRRDSYSGDYGRSNRERPRKPPMQNDWDEDDDWF